MITAAEIQLRSKSVAARYQRDHEAVIAPFVNAIYDRMVLILGARKVHAKRARKLRRRGETVNFYTHSKTGKAQYIWIKKAND